jgi:hypothetical protein
MVVFVGRDTRKVVALKTKPNEARAVMIRF